MRPRLLFAFKHTCPTCALAAPFVERIHRRAGDRVEVRGLAQDLPEDAGRFVRQHALTFPVELDLPPYATGRALALIAVPTLIWQDGEGRTIRTEVGFSRDGLASLAEELGAGPLFEPGEDVPALRPG